MARNRLKKKNNSESVFPSILAVVLLGATVVPVSSGSKTLKDARNEAMRDWVTNVESTFYILGTAAGPHHLDLPLNDHRPLRDVVGEHRSRLPREEGPR